MLNSIDSDQLTLKMYVNSKKCHWFQLISSQIAMWVDKRHTSAIGGMFKVTYFDLGVH